MLKLLFTFSLLLLTACGGGRGGGTDANGNPIGLGLEIRKVSGDNQGVKKGLPFPLPLVAKVTAPDGYPVPDMTIDCKEISSTDGVITGQTSFVTDRSGLISTTVLAPSAYDIIMEVECRIRNTPNLAVFTLETVFVVDRLEWAAVTDVTPISPPNEPPAVYTADHINPMTAFQVKMIDADDGTTMIDLTGGTRHWITMSVLAPDQAPLGDLQEGFVSGFAEFSDVRYIKADSITLRATHNKSGKFIDKVITVNPNVINRSVAVLPGQTYTSGVMTLAQAVTGVLGAFNVDNNFNVDIYTADAYFNTVNYAGAVSVQTPNDLNDTEPVAPILDTGSVKTFTISPVQAKASYSILPISALATNNSSTAFTMQAGAPTQLITRLPGETFNPGQTSLAAAITGAPTQQVAGTAFAPQVYATDAEFNLVSVTPNVSITTTDPSDVHPANKNLVAGSTTFNITDILIGNWTISASTAGYATNASTAYNVKHNIATQIVITSQPTSPTPAGADIEPVAEIRDAYGNLVSTGPDATANVTMSLFSGTGVLAGTVTTPAVGGIVDFSGVGAYATLIGAKTIRLTKADTTGTGGTIARTVNSNSFNITHGPAAVVAWTTQPVSPTGAGEEIAPALEIRDAFTNLVTSGVDATANITLSLQSGTGVLLGSVTKASSGGIVNFSGEGANIELTGVKVLRATKADTSGGGGTAAAFSDSNNFTIIHGPATQIALATPPNNPTVAGAEIGIVAEIQDTFGNIVYSGPDATATVSLNLQSGTGTLGGVTSKSAILGVADFTGLGLNITSLGAKVIRSTKASTVGSGGTVSYIVDTASFNIIHAPASKLVFTTGPTNPTVAGIDIVPIIEIRDAYENIVTSGDDSTTNITLSIQTGTGTLGGTVVLPAVAGVVTWTGAHNLNIDLIGTKILRASKPDNSGGTGAGALTKDSASFVITHAPASALAWSTEPTNPTVAGVDILPVIQIQDAFTNVVTTGADATTTITLNLQTGTGVLNGTLSKAAVNGVVSFTAIQSLDITTAGSKTLRATKPDTTGTGGTASITEDSASFDITHAAANSIAWTTQPTSAAAGTNLTPQVTIYDVYSNIITSDNTSVITLSIQTDPSVGATLAGDVNLTVTAGVATWTAGELMFLNKIGTGFRLQASDGTRTANSALFNVTPAAPASLSWTTQPASTTAGTNLTPVVKILDALGNIVTTDNTSVITLSIQTDPSVGATLAGDIDLTVTAGVATWTAGELMFLNKIGTGFRLQASGATFTANSALFNVTPAAPASLSWTTQPASAAAGTNLTPVVKILDTYANIVNTDNASVITLSIQTDPSVGATLSGDVNLTVTAGVATWTAGELMFLNKIGTGFRLQASDGTRTANSALFNVTPAAPASLSWTTQPASAAAGTNLTPVVKILDTYANIVNTDNASVITLSIQTDPSVGATLAGDIDLTVTAGVATWTAGELMYLNKIGTGFRLQATDGTLTANSALFNVTPAAPASLSWTTQPASAAAGTNLTPVVKILDTYANIVNTDNASVITLSIQTDPSAGATLAGDIDLTVTAGVATWTASELMFLDKTGTGFRLQATDGTRTANSALFNVTPAAAASLSWTTEPASAAAGTNLTPVVKILDTLGNIVTTDNTSVITLSIQTDPSVGATLAGDVNLTVTAGVATWTALDLMFLNKIGTGFRLQATDGTFTANSALFNVTPAAAASLSWTTQPASAAAGTNLTPVVKILDTYSNVVTTDNASVITLSIQTDPSVGATLAGDVDLTVTAGIATWTAGELMFLNKIGTGFRLQASDGTRTANSALFNVTPAAPASLSWTTQPASAAAGTNLTPVVKILDTYANVVNTDNASVITLSIQTDPSVGATLSGDVNLTVSAGVATWTAGELMYLNKIGTGFRLQASDGTRTANSALFNVTPAAAASLSWTTSPASGAAGTNLTPVVKILDAYSNVIDTDNASTITLSIQTDPSVGATLAGDVNLTVSAGVATWTAGELMYLNKIGTGFRLQASDGTRTANSALFNVTPAAAASLSWTTSPASGAAGTNLTPVVKILDAYSNVIDTDNASTITLSIQTDPSVGATLAGDVNLTVSAGVATWTAGELMFLNKIGTGFRLQASDGTRTANSALFNVTPAAAASLSWTTQPASTSAGTNLTPVIKILDTYSNVVDTDNASVITLSIQTDPSGTTTLAGDVNLTVTAGVATWTAGELMFLNKIGTGFRLQASDGTRTANSALFNVTPAAPASLSWTTEPTSAAAGTNLTPVVKILDALGNIVTTDNASVITLSIQTDPSVGATLAGDVNLTVSGGVATWTAGELMYLNKIGTGFRLQASDGTRTANSALFNVTPAAPASLSWTTEPTSAAAGTNLTPVVKILDTYSNVVNTDNTSVITLSIQTDPSVGATLAGDVNLTVSAGVATWTALDLMYLNKIGTGFRLQATDGTRTANSALFNVTPAAASSLSWTTSPASGAAGTNLTPVVKILDTYSNVVTTDNASVITLSIQTDPSGTATLAGDVDLTVTAGVATWTAGELMYLNKIGTGFRLQATDGTRTANSALFNVTPATPASLSWTTSPASAAAGTNLTPVVKILDTYSNVVNTDNTSVITLSIQTDPSGTATLAGDVDLTVTAGVATWTAGELMFLNKTGTGFRLQASDGTLTANSALFNVTPAAAASLSWTTQPASAAAGTNLTPVVKILDTLGNIVTTDNTSVITLSIQTDPSVGATLSGDVDLTVTAGVATWTAGELMYLNKIGTGFRLQASGATFTANSALFNVTPAAPASLSWTTNPTSAAAGTNLTPVVKILDAYSNVIDTDNASTITLSIQTDPSVGATLSGDVDLTVTAGVATWTAGELMYLNKVGTGFRLQASDGTRTANSALFNVTPAAPASLSWTTSPASAVAGTNLTPVVKIIDAYSNVITSDNTSTITLSIQTDPSAGATLAGDVDLTVTAGVATWTAGELMFLNKIGTGFRLQASGATFTANSALFNVTPAAAASLSWAAQPSSAAAGTNLTPEIQILDSYGNIRTTDSASTITLSIQTDPSVGATLAGDVNLTVTAGVATWTAGELMFLNKIGTGFRLQASDGTRTANSALFNVTPAAPASLSWTTSPTSAAAGTNLTPVVKILDTYANVVNTDNASVITLSIQTDPSVGATLAGDVDLTVTAGVATWTAGELMFLNKIGTGFRLQASDGTRTANSALFNVTPAAPTSLSWTTQPASTAAGTNLTPVIKILDTYSNVVDTDNTSVITLSIQTDPSGTATLAGDVNLTVTAGAATWTAGELMFLNKIGTGFRLQASDGTRTANSALFNVTPAAAASLSWTTSPASGAAGTNLTPVVKILDSLGNIVTTDNTSVITLSIQTDPSVGATLAGDVDLTVTAGVATWTAGELMFLNKIGTGFRLQASGATFTANSALFNVTPAAPASLSWTTSPASAIAGTNLTPVVKILDAYSNVIDTDNASTITLSIQTDPSVGATLAGDVDLIVTAGVATWTAGELMFLNKIGTGFRLQASDGTRTANSALFNVTPAAASSLSWTTSPASAAAGTNLTPVVKILDTYSNVVDTDNASVITLSIQTDPSVGATLAGDIDLTVTAGVATWTAGELMFLNKIGTSFRLQATDGTLTANSALFNVTPAAPASLSWTTSPASAAAGTNLTPVIKILDAYANVVNTDNASVITLSIQTDPSGTATLAGDVDLTVTAGVATWTAGELMFLNKIGTGFRLQASDGTRTANSALFNVTPAAAASLSWTTQPASAAAGTNLTPVVKILDSLGNIVTTDNTSVITLSIQTDPSVGATLAGDVDLTVTAGVATWTAGELMFLNKIGTGFRLQASGATFTANSALFNVTPAAPASLSWTASPASGAAGTNLTPVVKILDAYSNVIDTDNASTITLSIQTDPSVGATLAGDVDLIVTAGVATWTAGELMFLNKIGTGFRLQASDGTRTANSALFNVTPAAAASLSWTTSPASAIAGTNLTPVVKILDTYANVVNTDNASTITLSIQTDPSVGATLAGDIDLTVTAGVATWTAGELMFLNKIGTGFRLQASDGTRTANSALFNVTPAAAASLSWAAQPSSGAAGANLTPEVQILDSHGNIRTTDSASTITLSIQTDPSVGATLAGDVDLTVTAGVATWTAGELMFLNKIGTGFRLQASDGTRTANSALFNVTPAAPASLSWTTSPASAAAGTNLTPVVKILDTYANIVNTDNASTITLSIQTDPSGTATLAGDVDLTVTAGVATWTAGELMFLNKTGTGFRLQASDGTRTANSALFNVTPAAAASLSWTTSPASGAAGTNLTPVVKILDTLGNIVTTDNTSVITLSIQTDPSVGATLAGDVDLTVTAGVATWTAGELMFLNKIGTGFRLQASGATFTANSALFNVTPAAPASLSWTTSPASAAAGTNLTPVVKILDAYSNVIDTDNASVITLSIQTDPSVGATLAGDVDLTVTAGVATWTAGELMYLNKIGTGFRLQASDGTRTANSALFNVTPAAPASLSWTTSPASGAAGTNLTPVVKILDAYSNVINTDNASTITLSIQTDPSVGATLAGDVDLTVTAGVATWTAGELMFLNKIGTGFRLQASDGTRTANSALFNVTPAAASSLSWTTSPASGAAGTNLTPVVKILDTYSNVVNTDNASVITLSIQTDPSVGATLAGDVDLTVTAGVATWTAGELMFLNKIGTGFRLQATDGTLTANSALFNITPAAPASLSWTTSPASAAAGTNLTPVIKILDAYANVINTDNASTITLSIQTDPSGTATLAGDVDLTVTAGVATWTAGELMFLNKIGTGFRLQASDGTRTANSALFNVTPAAAASLSWTTSPASAAAGTNLTPVVKILDTYSNVVNTDNTSVITLSIVTDPSVGATLAGDVDLTVTAGVATWTAGELMFLNKIGTGFRLQASGATFTANSALFNVTPAAAASLSWTTSPASGAAGTNLTPVVKILDAYSNVIDTDNASTITLSIQTDPSVGATLAGDVDLTVTAGVATWTAGELMYLNKIGTGFRLQASDGTRTANSALFNVTPAAPASLSWTTSPASAAAGTNLTPVVKILDAYSNVIDTDNASTITLSIQTDPSAGATLAGDVDLTVTAGVATWSAGELMFLNKIGTGFRLQASDGTRTANSALFNVTPAAAASLSWTAQPSSAAAGTNLTPEVQILDSYGNIRTTDSASTITLSIQTDPSVGATLAGDVNLTVTAGVATWTAGELMFLNKIGTGFRLQASDGTRTANSALFNVTPAAPASLSWTTSPASAIAGTNLTPVVKILDAYSNVIDTDNASTITLSIQTDPSVGATLAGDIDLTVTAGVATWTAGELMFLNKIGTGFRLQASDGTRTANSALFNVTPAAPASLSWTTSPASAAAGTNLTPTVKILDTHGNTITTDNTSTITLSIQTDPSVGATLAGDIDLTVTAGVATWTAGELMFLNKIGTGFRLQASDGTRTANSALFNVTPAAATSLSWTTSPASGVAGTNLTPVVKILDTYSNVVNTDNASVITLSIQTDPSVGAVLAGDVDLTVTAGVATWTAGELMFLDKVGTGFRLQASDGTRTANSALFNVTPAAASVLVWNVQPSSAVAGTNLTPEVEIRDAYGNIRTGDSASTITLTIQTDPSVGATLAGDVDLTVSAGVATWSAGELMFLNKTGTGFRLQASDGTRTANSALFNVTPAAAAGLSWTTQPASAAAGTNLTPVVKIVDTYSNVISTDSASTITLSIQTDPSSGATLSGDLDLTVSSGVATWTAGELLRLNKSGTGFRLQASGATFTANSGLFNVTGATPTLLTLTGSASVPEDNCEAYTISRYDTYGNLSDVAAATTVTIGDGAGSGQFFDTADTTCAGGSIGSIDIAASSSSVVVYYMNSTPESITLTGSSGGLTSGTKNVTITPCADHFDVELIVATAAVTTVTSDVGFDVRLTARDGSNALATCYTGAKTATWTMNGTTAGTLYCSAASGAPVAPSQTALTFVAGVATTSTTNGVFKAAEATATVDADIGSVAGTSANITVNPGTICHVEIRTATANGGTAPTTQTIDLNNTSTLYLAGYDKYANYNADVAATWSGAGGVHTSPYPASSSTSSAVAKITGTKVATTQTITANAGAGEMTDTMTMTVTTTNPTNTITSASTANDGDATSNILAADTTRIVSFWDATGVAPASWRTVGTQAWFSEAMTANLRGSRKEFPPIAHLVATNSGLDIVDASNNQLWMRFTAGANNIIDSNLGSITSVRGLNDKIYVTMNNGAAAGGLIIIDFNVARAYRITAAARDATAADSITSRNSAPAWSNNTTYPLLGNTMAYALDVRRATSIDYIVVSTGNNAEVYKDNAGTIAKYINTVNYTGVVTSSKLTSAGKLYIGVDGVGIHIAAPGFPISANYTSALAYGTLVDDLAINTLDVAEGVSAFSSTENILLYGTDTGLKVIQETTPTTSSTTETYMAATSTSVRNAVYGGFYRNGANGYITTGATNIATNRKRAIEMFFMPTSTTLSGTYLMQAGTGNGSSVILFDGSNQLAFGIKDNGSGVYTYATITTKNTWSVGKWYFLSAVGDSSAGAGTNMKIDVYDADASAWKTSGNVDAPNSVVVSAPLVLAADSTGANNFPGYIDEVHYYNDITPYTFNGGSQGLPPNPDAWSTTVLAIKWTFSDAGGRLAACTTCTLGSDGTLTNKGSLAKDILGGTSHVISEVKAAKSGTVGVAAVCTSGAAGAITRLLNLESVTGITAPTSTALNCSSTDIYQFDSTTDYDTLTGISGGGIILRRQ